MAIDTPDPVVLSWGFSLRTYYGFDFLADRRAIGTVLCLSVCLSVLLLRAYMKSYMRNRLVPKWMTLTFV